ncbi:hypothetical protein OHB25_05465 [Streptomyces mirabilis]
MANVPTIRTVLVAEVAERDTAAIDLFAMRFGAVCRRSLNLDPFGVGDF